MTIKAIQTRYAGCHFRSRLEARWAVFFDHLGMAWQYEPQGFDMDGVRYLPDFWLPETEVWIEVKGHQPNETDIKKLLHLASEVCADGHRVRLLGPIPDVPIGLKPPGSDDVVGWGLPCVIASAEYIIISPGSPTVNDDGSIDVLLSDMHGIPPEHWTQIRTVWIPGHAPERIGAALHAARSARFEHGHSGAS